MNILEDKRLLLVDGHAVAFHCWYTSEPPSVVDGFEDMVDAALERNGSSHLIIAFDPPPPTFRHHLWPSYKEGRPPVEEEFLQECETVRDDLDATQTIHITVEGYEADDVIGTVAKIAEAKGFHTTIFTVDMDLLQLVTDSTDVEAFSQYHGLRSFDKDAVIRRFAGLSPGNVPDFKALVGDRSDNLPGIPGIGATSAGHIFQAAENLEEIYGGLKSIESMGFRGSKRVASLLAEHREQAFLMRKLTTIVKDLEIDLDLELAAT